MLSLRDRHAVSRHDDHALAFGQELVVRRRSTALILPRGARCGSRRRATLVPKPPGMTEETAVHGATHDVGQDRSGGSDERAGNDQQIVGEHETRGGGAYPE